MVCVMNYQEKIWSKYFCIFMALSFSSTLYAQDVPPDVMDGILRGYKDASGASTPGTGWFASIEPVARSLFWKLAAIEFAWSAIVWTLQQENMQSFDLPDCRQAGQGRPSCTKTLERGEFYAQGAIGLPGEWLLIAGALTFP